MAGLTVAFHSDQLGFRGTDVALYDYAHWNEILLGNRSFILAPARGAGEGTARFRARFPVHLYEGSFAAAERVLRRERADCLYAIKAGFDDGIVSGVCRTAVHAVFPNHAPHGDRYAYISPWLSRVMSGGQLPVVPFMVSLPQAEGDLRAELGIPRSAIVFGRHGGPDSFDIPWVHDVVAAVADRRADVFFVFLATERFCAPRPNVIHLPPTTDPVRKVRFIRTCDAMLHARRRGETFGLAIAEFSLLNRPVLTFADRSQIPEQAHLDFLGERALSYVDPASLRERLEGFRPQPDRDWNAFRAYTPRAVARLFERVFLS